MRVVVTGREGQVVRSLMERASRDVQIVPIGRPELDLAASTEAIVSALTCARPDVIVSAAAYTQVDKAEHDPQAAFAVNRDGARAVAIAAHHAAVPLIHLSTDYVFNGTKSCAYVEEDPTDPTSIYGTSKLQGEQAVLAENQNTAILRTAWVYSPFGANFVKTMLRLAYERDEISIVADQWGNPTSALEIAAAVLKVAANLLESDEPLHRGVFHMTAEGEASWAEFAEAIFSASADLGGPTARVKRIGTSDYRTAATRPSNSRLDSSKLAFVHGVRLPDWHASLKKVLPRLLVSDGQEKT